ncbi:hypothetical protein KPL74_04570 [Bacillus sp. NP157]|nr:hypothetical protein KPL74_04570 [Bacillus sp. NP157]
MRQTLPCRTRIALFAGLIAAGSLSTPCFAQTQDPGQVVTSVPCAFDGAAPTPGPACLLAHEDLGPLPSAPLYWHIDVFPSVASATAARGTNGVVVTDFGKVWLFTIAGKEWRPRGGEHAASVGPLPMTEAASFSAEYVHSFFAPGMSAPTHKHSGPEGFYAVDGDTCVEMPGGAHVGTGPGNTAVMPGGEPMLLMAIGSTPRRGFAVVVHDSTLPATTRVSTWKPAGRCEARLAARP